ncbi:hypothetical protein BKA58DRAFT_440416 [Alternaria rosae]|uniref:uncharacterized protein n=1 Tax=Alternaria rosae TaxID=1187941 RepID=UPI001E8E3F2E|nr:uncharacterized protein BKA58DRAFT_440416 [Alternaria rosae]KAH6867952.1 hypothetical protein BKA58DRAFT_440416 [Alternaria rosae]
MVTTRNKNYSHENALQKTAGLDLATEPIDFRRARWAHLLRTQDYKPIVSEVLEEELPKYARSTAINVNNRIAYIAECANILASASPVFASAVEGDLVRQMKTDASLQQEYDLIWEAARNQPSIYIHQLADCDGIPPTPNQYLAIRDYVADYIDDSKVSEYAWQIDTITHPPVTKQKSASGRRKYLETSACERWTKRVKNLKLFCQGVLKRWHETPASLRDTPFRYPPSECGYSARLHERIEEHRTRQSSNSVMNLVEDICTYLHNTGIFKQHFRMHPYVIYLIFRPEQAVIAEIFCSGLLQVWVKIGGGFNAYHAGRSVHSASTVSGEKWASYEQNARLNSPLIANMRMQQLDADEWRQALALRDENTADSEKRESASQEENYCITFEHPRSYPAALLKKRHTLPSHLHICVERPSRHAIRSSRGFNYNALNSSSIEAHFQRNIASSFISLYESEATASRKHPHTDKLGEDPRSFDAAKMAVDTSGLTAAWVSVDKDVRLPVWFDKDKRGSDNVDDEEVLWFCLQELKTVLQVDEKLGEKDEWLACGFIPRSRVVARPDSLNEEYPEGVVNDKEIEEDYRQARRDRQRIERERLPLERQEFEHRLKKTLSSGFLNAPQIPSRKSSLASVAGKAVSQSKKIGSAASKIRIETRDVSVSLTNADPRRAASLMKYALLLAHEKRFEAEESWLSETTRLAGGVDRGDSTRTIDDGGCKERQSGLPDRDTGAYLTPPESLNGSSGRRDTRERRGRDGTDNPVARQDDDQSVQERGRRLRRSAAPSPSQSLLGHHLEGGKASSLRPLRSRRDLLLELQSDEDSVLREYARVSLQDPCAHHRVRHDTPSGARSTSTARGTRQPPNYTAHDAGNEESKPPAPSVYSTMSSLSSLSDLAHATIEEATYASVHPGSDVREIEIQSKKSGSSSVSAAARSGEEERGRSRNGRRQSSEGRVSGVAVEEPAEEDVEPFPTFDPMVPEHTERGAPALPSRPGKSGPAASTPAPLTPSPVVLKSESFFTRSRKRLENRKDVSERLAEVRGHQAAQKTKVKKDIWELTGWRSGEKKDDKKDGLK